MAKRKDPLFGRPKKAAPKKRDPIEELEDLGPEFDGEFEDLDSDSANDTTEPPAEETTEQPAPADGPAEGSSDAGKQPPAPFPIKPDYGVYVVTSSGGDAANAKSASGKAEQAQPSSGSIQDIQTFVRNAEQFMSENQLEGSGLDYLRGALKSGVVELALKYVGLDGRPLTDLKPSDEFNKVACADVMRQLNEGEPVVASKAINTLIMCAGTEGFQQACEQMSDEERRSYAAGMEEIIRAGQQPVQPPAPEDSSPTPTQPQP